MRLIVESLGVNGEREQRREKSFGKKTSTQTDRLTEMDNAQKHWEILQGLGNELANKVREFMVIGWDGDGVIVATENGLGYWMGKMQFGNFMNPEKNESKQAMEPTRLDVPNLSCMAHSSYHILLLTKSGHIYAMGKNDYGQLGLGNVDQENHFSPQLISSQDKFISVRCGYKHSVALAEDGKVWAWGYNYSGQVGVPGSTVSISSPHKISKLNSHRVVAVECGDCYSLALTDLGEVYGWGWNGQGQLGDGSESTTHTPTRMHIPSPVQSMAAGNAHTLLLTQTGEVYACGRNKYGQLGLPTTTKSSLRLSKVKGLPPISQIASHFNTDLSIAMTSGHRCFVWGELANKTSISTPLELHYSTVDSPLSFFSIHRSTTHSISLPAMVCPRKTDSTTQTDTGSDSVSDQTMPSPNPILERMFNNPDFSPDVRFQVGDQTILAHRCVLQATSGHFHRLFSSQLADLNLTSSVSSTSQSGPNSTRHTTNPSEPDANSTIPTTSQLWSHVTIPISDHSYHAFHAYLRYLYLGILEVAPEHLADLFSLSVAYLESDLQQLCISRMRTTLSPATCCLYYPLTHRHSLPELSAFQQELVQFISTRTSEVYRTASYQSMDGDLCKKLSISIANLNSC